MLTRLRPYQRRMVKLLSDHLSAPAASRVALIAPTGSGKSLVVTALVAMCQRRELFESVVVAVPMVHIQSSFANIGKLRCGREVFEVDALWAHVSGSGATKKLCRSLVKPDTYGTVVTHAALTGPALQCIREHDLRGRLLIIDEGHHTTETDVNKVSKAREAWLKAGGSVLVVTATPFRHDRARVFDSSWAVVSRTIIDHVSDPDGPYAPQRLVCRTAILEGFRPKSHAALHDSTRSGTAARTKFAEKIVQTWDTDGRPKAVLIVPAWNAQQWARFLVASLKRNGVDASRILDATGTTKADQRRTQDTLDRERHVDAWAKSTIDVVIGCKRFDEATDWPMCSHVYIVGYPRSIPLTLQRWGRTFRDKQGIRGHRFPDVASVTFMIPQWTKALVQDAKKHDALWRYRDDAHLLACCLHDYTTGLEYAREAQRREDSIGLSHDGLRRAKARRDIDRARAKTRGFKAMVASLAALPRQRAAAALSLLAEHVARRSPADRKLVAEAWEKVRAVARRPGIVDDQGLLAESMVHIFREALKDVGQDDIVFDEEHLQLVADFTGQDVQELVSVLTARKDYTRTLDEVDAEILAFISEHGRAPIAADGNRWNNFEAWLYRRGTSLSKRATELGHGHSVKNIRAAVRRYADEHGERPYVSTSNIWLARDTWLRRHTDTSVARLCQEMGLGYRKQDTARSWERLKTELAEFQRQHPGEYPNSSEAPWVGWANWARRQGKGWAEATGQHERLSLSRIEKYIAGYAEQHGYAPSGKSSKEWHRREEWLRRNGHGTLLQRAKKLGCKPKPVEYRKVRDGSLSSRILAWYGRRKKPAHVKQLVEDVGGSYVDVLSRMCFLAKQGLLVKTAPATYRRT